MENVKAIRASLELVQKHAAVIYDLANTLEGDFKKKIEEIRNAESKIQVDITRILAMLASQDEELQKELQENANLSAQSVVSQPVSPLDSDVIAVASLRPDTELLEPLLKSDQWPQAVNEYLICDLNSEDDKDARAQGIIAAMIDPDLTGKKFLDFGCGEGHVVNERSV
jgi:hypothetical protein